MNEFIDFMQRYLKTVQASINELSDEEASVINEFIRESLSFIQSSQKQQAAPAVEAPTLPKAPVPYGTDMLWELSGANPEAFVNYVRTVPDPSINALLQNPSQLQQLIQQFQQTNPQAAPQSVQGIEKAPLQSSNIYGFRYDPKSGRMLVRFQGGSIYEYEGVPNVIFNLFQKGAIPAKTNGQNQYGRWWRGKEPSTGASFFELIKKGPYPYAKVA